MKVLKGRLAALGKNQLALINELKNRGEIVGTSSMSDWLNGFNVSERGEYILKLVKEILDEWEGCNNGKDLQ